MELTNKEKILILDCITNKLLEKDEAGYYKTIQEPVYFKKLTDLQQKIITNETN